jgi:hypothetical protein
MKRRYLTFTIRQLKAKLSNLSRTSFKITRNFFKSRLGIDKRDWSRLTKAQIIKVLDFYYSNIAPISHQPEIKKLLDLGFLPNLECLNFPNPDEIFATFSGWQITFDSPSLCAFKGGLWMVFEPSNGCDYDALIAAIKADFCQLEKRSKPIQLSLF